MFLVLKLHFHKSKLGMQSLSYVGFRTRNKLFNDLQTTTDLIFFKHGVKKYFLKKLSETDGDIYSYD